MIPQGDDRWQRGHTAARLLHDALLQIGVPEAELTTLTARADEAGRPRVHIPRLDVASAELLLAALAPYLGPAWIGRRDVAPIAPGGPPPS
jgi:hypothetical protein